MIPQREFPKELLDEIKKYNFTLYEFEAAVIVAILERNNGLRFRSSIQLKIDKRRFIRRLRWAESLGFKVMPSPKFIPKENKGKPRWR
jgi:hypothetical protein